MRVTQGDSSAIYSPGFGSTQSRPSWHWGSCGARGGGGGALPALRLFVLEMNWQRLAGSPGSGATRWRNPCPRCCPGERPVRAGRVRGATVAAAPIHVSVSSRCRRTPSVAKSPEAKSPLQAQPHSRYRTTPSRGLLCPLPVTNTHSLSFVSSSNSLPWERVIRSSCRAGDSRAGGPRVVRATLSSPRRPR